MTDWKKISEEEWKKRLSPIQFEVTRKAGTERPFTGEYWNCTDEGFYHCSNCQTELFSSQTKFDAGCGWPSFFDSLDTDKILKKEDLSHGMRRVEIVCATCNAHLGHLFDDGPKPTGQRYCVNSASINLMKTET